MASAIGLKPNHYQVLGVDVRASAAEIERAFKTAISPLHPHAFGQVAEASVAYRVLRNPELRRDYDRSIGIGAPDKPPLDPLWSGRTWSIRASTAPAPAPRPAVMPPLPTAPAAAAPPAEKVPEPAPLPSARPEPFDMRDVDFAEVEEQDGAGRRTALIAAGLIAAVGLGGALLGWSAGGEPEAGANAQMTLAVPKPAAAEPSAIAVDELMVPPGETLAPRPRAAIRERAREARVERAQPVATDAPAALPPSAPPTLTGEPEAPSDAGVPPAPESPPSASLPLSNRAIARTIERIGYACGSVSSAVPAGTAGVFTVNCSSGQSFRASPRGGRYRFKRLNG